MWEGARKLDICEFRDFAKTTFSTETSSSKSMVEGIVPRSMGPRGFLSIIGIMFVKRKNSRVGVVENCEIYESSESVVSYFYRG